MTKRNKGAVKDARAARGARGETQGELLALALFALGLFLLLALLPVAAMGDRALAFFSSGNAIGPVGARVATGLWATLGAAAVVVPTLFLIGGLRAGGWLSRNSTLRLGLLAIGLLLLVPAGLYALMDPPLLGAGGLDRKSVG